jgi:hypothetical protein
MTDVASLKRSMEESLGCVCSSAYAALPHSVPPHSMPRTREAPRTV